MRVCSYIALLICCFSCQTEVDSFLPTEKFNSIFEDPSEGVDYQPLDIIETQDGGLMVLAELNNRNAFILKITTRGDLQWSTLLPTQIVDPVASIIQKQDKYYFIASTVNDRTTTLIEVSDTEQTAEPLRSYSGYRRPLAFGNLSPDTYLLLTHNDTIGAVLSKIQDGFAMEWARRYDDIPNSNQLLDNYLINNRADFFVGSINNNSILYFNTLREEGMTLTYTDSEGIESGSINGSQSNALNTLIPFGNGNAAVNYIFNGDAYFNSTFRIENNRELEVGDLSGEAIQDRSRLNKATTSRINLGVAEYIVNAYSSIDGRIKLNFYDSNSGQLVAIKNLGGADPLEVIKIISTADEGIVILAKITIVGAKDRISVTKLAREELINIL